MTHQLIKTSAWGFFRIVKAQSNGVCFNSWQARRFHVIVRTARSRFFLFLFFSWKRSVASAKNITSSLLSISRCRNWSPALLKPMTSWKHGSMRTHRLTQSDHMRSVITVVKSILFLELTLISRTLKIVLVLNSSMTDSSIWLLVIWPKWTLGKW